MRLIDADELKKYISSMPLINSSKEMFKNAIKAQPTAFVYPIAHDEPFNEAIKNKAYNQALEDALSVVEWDGYTLDIKNRIEQLKR